MEISQSESTDKINTGNCKQIDTEIWQKHFEKSAELVLVVK